MGNLLSAIMPKARIVPAVDPTFLNRNPAGVKAYLDDPLNTPGALPVRTGNESLKMFRWLRAHYSDFTLPIYAIHGTGDRVTSIEGTRAFVKGANSGDKRLIEVEGAYHEPLFEDGGGELVEGVAGWILKHAERVEGGGNGGNGSGSGAKL